VLRERGFLPPLRPRGCQLSREEAGVLWDRLVATQHALIDLTEGADPDVTAAEALVTSGRRAGLPEPYGGGRRGDGPRERWNDRRTVEEIALNERRREAKATLEAKAAREAPTTRETRATQEACAAGSGR
jgi:hypothetical protein